MGVKNSNYYSEDPQNDYSRTMLYGPLLGAAFSMIIGTVTRLVIEFFHIYSHALGAVWHLDIETNALRGAMLGLFISYIMVNVRVAFLVGTVFACICTSFDCWQQYSSFALLDSLGVVTVLINFAIYSLLISYSIWIALAKLKY